MHIKQRIYGSLSATVVAALFTFLCYGPLPAASNESKSLPGQEGWALAQLSERSTAAETAHSGVDIVLPEGEVEAVLTRDMTARSPTREFAEDAKQVYLVLTSALAKAASVQASEIAVSV